MENMKHEIKTVGDLKNLLNGLTNEQLSKPIYYDFEGSQSGQVLQVIETEEDLLYDGEDDPSELQTRQEFLADGFDEDDVDSFEVEIPKGSFLIKITH